MERYPKYKDSGIPWLGLIPEHWEMKRAKYMFLKNKRERRPEDEVITCFRDGQVTLRRNRRTTGFTESEKYDGYQGIRKGDLVIHQMDAFAGSVGVSDSDGMGTSVYHCCTPLGAYNVYYYAYLIRHMALTGYIQSLYKGIRERSSDFSFPIFGNQFLAIPPLDEQERIVDYINAKSAKIDSYIAEREKELQVLSELKQSQIANAVTRGLDPHAPMKDSGIPWIGMIPKHWDVVKISQLFRERKEKVSDKDYPALSVSKQGITPQLETAVKTDDGDNRKKVCIGDFVVNSRSDRKGSCGVSQYDGSVSLINIVLEPREEICGVYFHHLFRSNDYIEEFYRLGRGIVADLWTTRYSEMKNIFVPLPPLEERSAIVDFINAKCEQIGCMIAGLESEVANLKEYKQRMIADAVTGAICVQ